MRPRPHRTRRRPTNPPRRPTQFAPPDGRNAPVSLLAFKKYASVCRCTIVRHPDCDADGLIHPDSVIAPDNPSDADDGTCTTLLDPLNDIAPPYRPAADHDAPCTTPVFPFPDTSTTDDPDPASNEYPATNPAGSTGPAGVVTSTTELIATQVSRRVHSRYAVPVCRTRTTPACHRSSSTTALPTCVKLEQPAP